MDIDLVKCIFRLKLCKICGFNVKKNPGPHMKNHHPGFTWEKLKPEDPFPSGENAFCQNLREVLLYDEKPVKPQVAHGGKKSSKQGF